MSDPTDDAGDPTDDPGDDTADGDTAGDIADSDIAGDETADGDIADSDIAGDETADGDIAGDRTDGTAGVHPDADPAAVDDGSLPAVRLVPATGSAVEWIHSLLERADLPTADLAGADPTAEDGPALYVVVADGPAERGGDRVGCIGVEPCGEVGLLRSAAIVPSARGQGYGAAAVRALEREADDAGLTELYLLTTTAADFFERLGYERVDRDAVPEPVRASREFAELCPDSATAMSRSL